MSEHRWINGGCKDGLYCIVTDGEKVIRLATPADASQVVDMLNALERDAAFGRQCIQDDCEGAWIAATVHKIACKQRDHLLECMRDIATHGKSRTAIECLEDLQAWSGGGQ